MSTSSSTPSLRCRPRKSKFDVFVTWRLIFRLDGCFVIEAFVPDLTRFTGGQVNWATKVTEDMVELDVGRHDPATQRVISQKVVITDGSVRLFPVQIRYVWPSELDLMAQLAGLRLRERWSNWNREPFTSESGKHISFIRNYPRHE